MSELQTNSSPEFARDQELDRLDSVVREILGQAKSKGCSDAEVTAHASLGLSVTVRMGDVELLEHTRDSGVDVTVYRGRNKGHANCADLSEKSIRECVERAIDIARFTQEDPCNGLASKDLMATEFPDLDLWHPVTLDAESAIQRAKLIEAAGREDPGITNSEGASVSAGLGLAVYGNTHGFVGRSSGTRYSQNCVLIGGKGDGMQRDYSYDSRRALEDLEPPETTGQQAAMRALRRLNARKLGTAHLPVLFAPDVARSLVGHLVAAVSGSALYRNSTFLKGSAGTKLFPDWVNIVEKPRLPRGQGSGNFDADGVATRERRLVENGVLNGYVLGEYSARRLGLQTTANAGGVRNVFLSPGGEGCDNPLAAVDRALLVTEVMGQGVKLVTGDYSRGAAGFIVENGELAYPVEEVTIAANLRDMFAGMQLAGHDLDTRGNIQAGSILVDRMMVAGQ